MGGQQKGILACITRFSMAYSPFTCMAMVGASGGWLVIPFRNCPTLYHAWLMTSLNPKSANEKCSAMLHSKYQLAPNVHPLTGTKKGGGVATVTIYYRCTVHTRSMSQFPLLVIHKSLYKLKTNVL